MLLKQFLIQIVPIKNVEKHNTYLNLRDNTFSLWLHLFVINISLLVSIISALCIYKKKKHYLNGNICYNIFYDQVPNTFFFIFI